MLELGLQEKHFEDVKNGKKTVEGRLFKEKYSNLKSGNKITFFKDLENGTRTNEKIIVKVKDVQQFNNVDSMLKEMKLKSILPRARSYNEGNKVYSNIYGNALKNGKMIAFSMEVASNNSNNKNNKKPHVPEENNNKKNKKPQVASTENKFANRNKQIVNITNKSNKPRHYELYLRQPWFALMKEGLKEVEGRLYRGAVEEYRVGDVIHFIERSGGKENILETEITKLTKYPDFKSLLFHEKSYKVLPGIPNIKCGNEMYEKIYNYKFIKQYGALAIQVKILSFNSRNAPPRNNRKNNNATNAASNNRKNMRQNNANASN